MKDIGRLLREGDPVARESFPAMEVDGMLGRLRFEAERGAPATGRERQPWGAAWRAMATALACVAVLAVAVLAWRDSAADRASMTERSPERVRAQRVQRVDVAEAAADAGPVRQVVPVRHLQFATPEGVRVFWTFDPDFQEN